MKTKMIRVAIAAALCISAVLPSLAATVVWKSNAQGYMNVASNWTGDTLPQDGDTLDMSILTTPSSMYVGDFGDERRFETMTLWRTRNQLVLREGTLRLQYLTYSSGSIFGLSGKVVLDVSGKIKSTGSHCFAGCGNGTVVAGELEHAGSAGAYMCNTSLFSDGLVVKTGKFTISNSGYLSLSTFVSDSSHGVRYVVGAGGLSFGDGATSGAFYQNASKNKVRIDPSADYTLAANPARESEGGDNLAFMCHESTTYFGTTDYYDNTQPRTVTFAGGIGADKVSGRNVIVDGIGTLVFNACRSGSHEFNGALTVKNTATLLLRDTAAPGKGTKTFESGTTFKVEQTRPTGIVELKDSLTLAANSTLEFVLAENATTSALRVATLTLPATGKVMVKVSGVGRGASAVLIENLPVGTSTKQFELVGTPYEDATLVVSDNKLMVEKRKGLIIIIGDRKSASPAPVTAKILFAGDSTLDDYGRVVNPFASWGTTLENFMRSGCSVDNYAKSGASTKSFRANGYWSSLLAAIRPGDFVGIQFGHNDQKAGSNYAAPDGLFRDNIRQFVAELRALDGKPILLSPIVRGTFDDNGNLYETQLDNGTRLSQYATAMRELSVELGTDFVDMNALTHDLLVQLGKENSAKLFAVSAGKSGDYTHPITAGADAFAQLFVKDVKDRGLEVAALFF